MISIEWAEVVILAVPYGAVDSAIRELGSSIQGKTLVDVTNALTEDMQLASGCTTSGAEHLQQIARGARVVKGGNMDRLQSRNHFTNSPTSVRTWRTA